MSVEDVIIDIQKECSHAKYMSKRILKKWAQQIVDGKHQSKTEVPKDIDPESVTDSNDDSNSNSDINIDIDTDEQNDNDEGDNEYGDVVTVKNHQFVICSGLVVPQNLLKEKIIPMINEEMKNLQVDVDDVYNSLMENE